MGCTGVFPVVNQSSIFPLTPTLITSNLYSRLKQLKASTHSKTALNGNRGSWEVAQNLKLRHRFPGDSFHKNVLLSIS